MAIKINKIMKLIGKLVKMVTTIPSEVIPEPRKRAAADSPSYIDAGLDPLDTRSYSEVLIEGWKLTRSYGEISGSRG